MKSLVILVILFTFSVFANGNLNIISAENNQKVNRTFTIDHEHDQFLMDGKPFRFISGSFHYFRALPQTWQSKLRTMRAAGLNAVVTYVEWSLHNPRDGVYVWDGIADLERFIQLAVQEDLYVIFRPGPYICAERDLGGFPYWLLNKYPAIQLRTSDVDYLYEVRLWYEQLMSKMEPYLYGNGGPIIMVQVENEYGSFFACDRKYQIWLRDETERYVKGKAVLFTNDGPGQLSCGKIPQVHATLDFGATTNPGQYWDKLRQYEPTGPLVNAEFYPGWLTHWQEQMQRVATKPVVHTLELMLNQNASVNFYMFFGGTNFGFTAGANDGGPGFFNVDVTSYDYDAPMDEAGDPTPKYFALRESIGKYLPLPNLPEPKPSIKMSLGALTLRPVSVILSTAGRHHLASRTVFSRRPISFEAFDQNSGFLLFEATLPRFERDPMLLSIDKLRDRANIYVDRVHQGILSRENAILQLPISSGVGDTIQIFVENQGRINFNLPNDFKGILADVKLGGHPIYDWNITGFPFENYQKIKDLIHHQSDESLLEFPHRSLLRSGPTLFHANFTISGDIYDTYLNPTGWGKGVAFVNGFNLGRYWPAAGPQITLYVPKELLKNGVNEIVMLELQKAPENGTISFDSVPNLDGFRNKHFNYNF